ncbi:MAG: hypothetical protein JOZ96_10245 [Acidobacteria bacterium]|nr:hypothetical protein [Acidobacteriota bacterium]
MNAQGCHTTFRRQNLVLLLLLSSLVLVAAVGFTVSTARRPQTDQDGSEVKERKFENTIPGHVPIKVKLKSEKSFKDLQNKGWARELELEVKNTGSKPIHYLYVILDMPDVLLEDGVPLSFRVSYGRSWNSDANTPLRPDEPPIQPGESVTLKLQEKRWKAYEARRDEQKRADAKRVRLELQILDYGDGTGFESIQGVPLLYPPKKSALEKPPAKGRADTCKPLRKTRAPDTVVSLLKTDFIEGPASLVRVNFLLPEASPAPAAPEPDLCDCQNISDCFYGVITCPYQCPCDDWCQFQTHVSTGSCSTEGGQMPASPTSA